VAGGLLGNSVSNGNRTPGTLLGAGVGAYAGSQIGKGHALLTRSRTWSGEQHEGPDGRRRPGLFASLQFLEQILDVVVGERAAVLGQDHAVGPRPGRSRARR
jgi:hypothetical protein